MEENQSTEIRMQKGRWTEEECLAFETAYLTHGSNLKAITRAIKTRSLVQVRSHAQKVLPRLKKGVFKSLKKAVKPDLGCPPQMEFSGNFHVHPSVYKRWVYHSMLANYFLIAMKTKPQMGARLEEGIHSENSLGANPDNNPTNSSE